MIERAAHEGKSLPESEPYFVYRWEAHVAVQIALTLVTLALALPFAASALGHPLAFPWLGGDPDAHRRTTGFVGLGLIGVQLLMGLRGRMARRPLSRFVGRWRSAHSLIGMVVLLAALIHTGGSSGNHLNRALVLTLVVLVVIAQTGHLMKAIVWTRAMGGDGPEAFARMQRETNTDEGIVHLAGAQIHTFFSALVGTLLLFHVLGAYFF